MSVAGPTCMSAGEPTCMCAGRGISIANVHVCWWAGGIVRWNKFVWLVVSLVLCRVVVVAFDVRPNFEKIWWTVGFPFS